MFEEVERQLDNFFVSDKYGNINFFMPWFSQINYISSQSIYFLTVYLKCLTLKHDKWKRRT